jgi:hypothetical protein
MCLPSKDILPFFLKIDNKKLCKAKMPTKIEALLASTLTMFGPIKK